MKINWKVRFKNPVFIGQIVMAFFIPILAYMGITLESLTTWSMVVEVVLEAIRNPYVLMLVVASIYNAINDPTVSGVIGDSKQALTYEEPKKDK